MILFSKMSYWNLSGLNLASSRGEQAADDYVEKWYTEFGNLSRDQLLDALGLNNLTPEAYAVAFKVLPHLIRYLVKSKQEESIDGQGPKAPPRQEKGV
jgi:hypothetical protein